MKRTGKIAAVLFIVLSFCAGRLCAEDIEIKITAEVTYINEYYDILEGKIKIGDLITGRYIYDSETPDTNPLIAVGAYQHYSTPYGITLYADKFVFQTDPNNVDFLVGVGNCIHGQDAYGIASYNNLPFDNEIYISYISWSLDDYSCNAISSTELPATPPVLGDWPDNLLCIEASRYPGGGCDWPVLDAKVISAELVVPVEALVDISPDTLNLQSEGQFVNCQIRLPEGYDIADIEPNSILLEDSLQPEHIRITGRIAEVKFSRAELADMLCDVDGLVELKVTGELTDGTDFEGTDTIRIINKGNKQ
jgi:hypothetical protein